MAKKPFVSTLPNIKVNCDGCKFKTLDDGLAMWCDKIRMPMASGRSHYCIHKINIK